MTNEKIKELELENERLKLELEKSRLELEKSKIELEKVRLEENYDGRYWVWAVVAIAGFLYAVYRNLYS